MPRPTYEEFVDKFKVRKTTDDCYTPPEVYDAVADWVSREYGIDKANFLRPFYPGGDYQSAEYPKGSMVVDNPPFSILSKIVKWYSARKIPFFLFCPSLTMAGFTRNTGVTAIITHASITYANGAVVNTSFVTNLSPALMIRTAPSLKAAIADAQKTGKEGLPIIHFPVGATSSARLGKIASVDFYATADEARFIRKAGGREIFGGGWYLSPEAAAREAAAREAAAREAVVLEWLPGERKPEREQFDFWDE